MADHPADPHAVAAGGAAGQNQGLFQPLLDNNDAQGQRMFPLNDQAFVGFLSKVADAAVMGLLTLNIFSATYLLAWGKKGSVCIPDDSHPKNLQDFTLPSWVKVVIVGIPFTIYPFTVYISGMVKAAEQGRHALGVVAVLCLAEFIYGFLIGGVITVCMSEAPLLSVLIVTGVLSVLVLVLWGCLFKHPECLRNLIWVKCFRRQEAPNNNAALVPPNQELPPNQEQVPPNQDQGNHQDNAV